ncbi:unnamed protein product [Didymodactylos carnosus]|uniref:Uncharacterized protein n=1 Tax=Didymodactylos carnosus TaxID=1234261 RepID=A0A8S2VJK3_9BILA|nr:unnamed protein product [Didymodactylos carnosus]CAF4225682.1 unnamed protein product [Didymodactylos carnosus]CAF4403579.1 unnamed protein product [Didymodactylos carnosus]
MKRQRLEYYRIVGGLGTLVKIQYMTHLETSPITGRRRYLMISSDRLKTSADITQLTIMALYEKSMLSGKSRETQRVVGIASKMIQANLDIEDMRIGQFVLS